MSAKDGARRVDDVVIVSTNPETLDGLQRYLRDAGVAARCTRDVSQCTKVGSPNAVAFVVFPDDFPWEHVVVTLASLSQQRPEALPVLVTSRPDRFERVTTAGSVLIVPRPAWGWTILDAIRNHLEQHPSKRKVGARGT